MVKFNVAQFNYISGNYPNKLSALLQKRALESSDKSSQEFLYVFQEAAKGVTRAYRSMNRFFETIMVEDEKPDMYYLERSIHINRALQDVFSYFEGYNITPRVAKGLRFLEQDEKEGESMVDSMPTDVPLSLALVDPSTGDTELVTLILDSESGEAMIIDEEGETGTVPKDKIKSIQLMDEVPDAIKNVSGLGAVDSSDVTPSDDMAGFEDEGDTSSEDSEGSEGSDDSEDIGGDMVDSQDMGGEEGDEGDSEVSDEGSSEEDEEEGGSKKKKESNRRNRSRYVVEDRFNPIDVTSFVESFNSAYNGGYVMEEDVMPSILKGKGFLGSSGDNSLFKTSRLRGEPESVKIGNKEDLAETTFKGGYKTDPPEESKPIKKRSSDDDEAVELYKKGSDAIKSSSDFKFENKYKFSKKSGGNRRKIVRYK